MEQVDYLHAYVLGRCGFNVHLQGQHVRVIGLHCLDCPQPMVDRDFTIRQAEFMECFMGTR